MLINNREVIYLGNHDWNVDGSFASIKTRGSDNLTVQATGEIIQVTAEQADAVRAERDRMRSARSQRVATRNDVITADNLSYHMYNPNGRLYG